MPDLVSEDLKQAKRVGNVDVALGPDGFVESIKLDGKVLYLVDDPDLIERQLAGEDVFDRFPDGLPFVNGVSTDAIIAARPDCYLFDKRLGKVPLRTLQVGGRNPINSDSIANGKYAAIAGGANFGCGSSREHAALAMYYAGIGVVYAPSIATIHLNNLINNGMFPVRDKALMDRLIAGEEVTFEELARELDFFQRTIMKRGGLFPFIEAVAKGDEVVPSIETEARSMTMVEKMMAANMDTRNGAVKPGDSGMLKVDTTLCHDYTTAQVGDMLQAGLGRPPRVKSPTHHHSYPDHLTLMAQGLAGATAEEIAMVLDLRRGQEEVARQAGIIFHSVRPGDPKSGSDGICHQDFRENVVRPGQIIVGTDSHTCSGGALNSYAFGVGSSQIATAWEQDILQATVPKAIKVNFTGKLLPGCTGKDVMLYLAGLNRKFGLSKGADGVDMNEKVLEFCGDGLESLSADDQFVLANMSTECSAQTGIVAPNKVMIDYLVNKRGLKREELNLVEPDESAEYDSVIEVDLSRITPSLASPGHTGNFIGLDDAQGTHLDMAYAGSCTAGSLETLRAIAAVVEGRTVSIETHVQPGSLQVLRDAVAEGVVAVLKEAGITVIEEPGCGACIGAGPGGPKQGQVAISATNRNFPGRMGKGGVYLANPYVVASAALRGHVPSMQEYEEDLRQAGIVG